MSSFMMYARKDCDVLLTAAQGFGHIVVSVFVNKKIKPVTFWTGQ